MELGKFLNTKEGFYIAFGSYIISLVIFAFIISKTKRKEYLGRILIPLAFIELAVIFFLITMGFPVEKGKVGPSVVPRLWIAVIIILNLYIIIRAVMGKEEKDPEKGRLDTVFLFIGLVVLYLVAVQIIGYYISSFLFIMLSMYLLKYKKIITMLSVTVGWLVFSYYAFYKLLFVPLPKGSLIMRLFS